MNSRSMKILVLAAFGTSCASVPDVSVRHYLPKGSIVLRAVRTIGCSEDANKVQSIHFANAVTATPSYSRDNAASDTVRLSALSDVGSNSDVGFTFYDDGRLKGVNATSEGVGQEVVASAIKIAGLVLGLPGPGLNAATTGACILIKSQQSDDAPVTITSELREAFEPANYPEGATERWVVMTANPTDPTFTRTLVPHLPLLCARFGPTRSVAPLVATNGTRPVADATHLQLRQPAQVEIIVVQESVPAFTARRGQMADRHAGASPCGDDTETLWSGSMAVPQLGTTFEVPIPRAALFGKTKFQLSLAESGAIAAIGYGDTSGVPSLLGAITTGLTAVQPDTAAVRAAAAQSEADLIYQQRRQLLCEMNRDECPAE